MTVIIPYVRINNRLKKKMKIMINSVHFLMRWEAMNHIPLSKLSKSVCLRYSKYVNKGFYLFKIDYSKVERSTVVLKNLLFMQQIQLFF